MAQSQVWVGRLAGVVLGVGILLPDLPTGASAQVASELPERRGQALAQRLCVSCHLAPVGQSGSAIVGIPTLQAIANRQGQTGQNIERVLIVPHLPMPEIGLSNDEIGDIIAYLDTLRLDNASPLLPRPPAPNPENPK